MFNFQEKKKREPITPYLKMLHFLPVNYRLKFKISLLVFKCLNNMAPSYLKDLIELRQIRRRSSRRDDDFFLLKDPPISQFSNTVCAFSHCAPKVWNDLPFPIQSIPNVNTFKKALKTHYFQIAYEHANNINQ